MFAAVKSYVPLGDLMQGATVTTANDACIVMAEGIAGSEAQFTELMNARAKALGMTNSVFVNPTGLPADGLDQPAGALGDLEDAGGVALVDLGVQQQRGGPAQELRRDAVRRRRPVGAGVVVAGDQAPQPAAVHERDRHGRDDAHVREVLEVDR